MDIKAIFKSITSDWETGRALLTFEVEQGLTPKAIEDMRNKSLRLTAKAWRNKRSLDANAYYWSLLSELSRVLSREKLTTTAFLHNKLLRDIAIPKLIENRLILSLVRDTDKAEAELMENEIDHLKPTDRTEEILGERYRVYFKLKGSSEMNSKEFSELLNALVSECKEQGIETLTQDEISHLRGIYEVDNAI